MVCCFQNLEIHRIILFTFLFCCLSILDVTLSRFDMLKIFPFRPEILLLMIDIYFPRLDHSSRISKILLCSEFSSSPIYPFIHSQINMGTWHFKSNTGFDLSPQEEKQTPTSAFLLST